MSCLNPRPMSEGAQRALRIIETITEDAATRERLASWSEGAVGPLTKMSVAEYAERWGGVCEYLEDLRAGVGGLPVNHPRCGWNSMGLWTEGY